jgi:hypothetical protein
MKVTYMVERSSEGWNVFEDCRPLFCASGRHKAIELAYLMLVATKAAGGTADLFVRDSAGLLQDCGDDSDFVRVLAADPEDGGQGAGV